MVGALGTPTHTAVLDFLKQNKVPDLFVASGSRSWNQPTKYPTTFGWQPDYTVEGKILGDYIKKKFPGQEGLQLRPGRRLRHRRRRGRRADPRQGLAGHQADLHADQHQRRPADRRAEVGRLRGRHLVHGARVHGAGAGHGGQAQVRTAVGDLQRRLRHPHADGLPQGGHQRRCSRAPSATPTCPLPTTPATAGSSCSEGQREVQRQRRRSTATSSTAWRWPTRPCRRSRPPARTSPAAR